MGRAIARVGGDWKKAIRETGGEETLHEGGLASTHALLIPRKAIAHWKPVEKIVNGQKVAVVELKDVEAFDELRNASEMWQLLDRAIETMRLLGGAFDAESYLRRASMDKMRFTKKPRSPGDHFFIVHKQELKLVKELLDSGGEKQARQLLGTAFFSGNPAPKTRVKSFFALLNEPEVQRGLPAFRARLEERLAAKK